MMHFNTVDQSEEIKPPKQARSETGCSLELAGHHQARYQMPADICVP